jgi:hypothetical protein
MITEQQAIEMAVAQLRKDGHKATIVETKVWRERGGFSRRGEKRPDWVVAVQFEVPEGLMPENRCWFVEIFDDGTIKIPPIL